MMSGVVQRLGVAGLDRGPGWWPLSQLALVRDSPRMRRVALIWGVALVASVLTGIWNVEAGWNGLELTFLGMPIDVTIYPPFLISVLLALWLGPSWGGVAIYLANLASGLASGLSLPMSALFALAGVIETLMLWGSMTIIKVDPDLRRLRDVLWFVAASVVAAITASLAAILWNSSHGLDPAAGLRIWRGWVIGDLLQMLVVLIPLLRLAGRRARGWLDRQFVAPPIYEFSYTRGVAVAVLGFAVLGGVVVLGAQQTLSSMEHDFDTRVLSGRELLPRLREVVLVMNLLAVSLIVATGLFTTALARMGEQQRRDASRDSLTGCLNRRSFPELFHQEQERSHRLGRSLALLFVDLDRFKELNDEHGHRHGDLALLQAARRIAVVLRESDLLFRWGGEEFLALLPHTTAEEAFAVGERIRDAIAESPLSRHSDGRPIRVTASVGTVAAARLPTDPDQLVARADEACYEAKRQGRDRVVAAI